MSSCSLVPAQRAGIPPTACVSLGCLHRPLYSIPQPRGLSYAGLFNNRDDFNDVLKQLFQFSFACVGSLDPHEKPKKGSGQV